MEDNKVFSFFKGLLFGAIAGATAGVLLAPKAGEETRKDLKKLAEDYQSKATDLYEISRKMLQKKLNNLKSAGTKLDESKYMQLVNEVVDEVKKDSTVTSEAAKKIGSQLKTDWEMVKTEFNK